MVKCLVLFATPVRRPHYVISSRVKYSNRKPQAIEPTPRGLRPQIVPCGNYCLSWRLLVKRISFTVFELFFRVMIVTTCICPNTIFEYSMPLPESEISHIARTSFNQIEVYEGVAVNRLYII